MNEKLYYSIGEVSKMFEVNPSLLRFWEKEFPMLKPQKSENGTRRYTANDIELLKRIFHLTRDCGYTLDGVKDQLRTDSKLDDKMQLTETLTQMRSFLVELKKIL